MTKSPVEQAALSDTWLSADMTTQEDRRRRRWAIAIAILVHVSLFWVTFPEVRSETLIASEKPKVYLVQQPRFKKPEVPIKKEIPKQRAKKVPIPDPTPDEPEPIRQVDEMIEPQIDMPQTDWVVDIPDAPPVEEPTGPLVVGVQVQPPKRVFSPPPPYTEMARRARIQGAVILRAIIDKQGRVKDIEVIKPLPLGLTESGVKTLRTWRFEPSTHNGKPVEIQYDLTIHFGIN